MHKDCMARWTVLTTKHFRKNAFAVSDPVGLSVSDPVGFSVTDSVRFSVTDPL